MGRSAETLLGQYEGKIVFPSGMVDIYSTCLQAPLSLCGDALHALVHFMCFRLTLHENIIL